MQAQVSPRALTRSVEWSFLRFVRGLYFAPGDEEKGAAAGSGVLDPTTGLAGHDADRPIFQALLPVLSAGTWRFLARNGGYRAQEVIVAGRKRHGRLWDPAVWGNEPLVFGPSTFLWLAAAYDLLAASTAGAAHDVVQAGNTDPAGAVGRTVHAATAFPLTAGDRLAIPAALHALDRSGRIPTGLPPELVLLNRGLFLSGMLSPQPVDGDPGWTVEPVEDLALQYLDEAVVSGWVRRYGFLRRGTAQDMSSTDAALTVAFEGLFRAAGRDGKDHLLIPLARFFPALWRAAGGRDAVEETVLRITRRTEKQSAREALEYGFGSMLEFGPRLDAKVQRIIDTPWADRTESQKLLATEYEARYRPVHDEVRLLARRLRRELG